MGLFDFNFTNKETRELAKVLADDLKDINSRNSSFGRIIDRYRQDKEGTKKAYSYLTQEIERYSKISNVPVKTMQQKMALFEKGRDIANATGEFKEQQDENARFDTTEIVTLGTEKNNENYGLFRGILKTLDPEKYSDVIRETRLDFLARNSAPVIYYTNREVMTDLIHSASDADGSSKNNPSQNTENCVKLLTDLYHKQKGTGTENDYCSLKYIADTIETEDFNIDQETTMAAATILFLQKNARTKANFQNLVTQMQATGDPSLRKTIQEYEEKIAALTAKEELNRISNIVDRFLIGNEERNLMIFKKLSPYIGREDRLIASVLFRHFADSREGSQQSLKLLTDKDKLDFLNKDAIERFPKTQPYGEDQDLFLVRHFYEAVSNDLGQSANAYAASDQRAEGTRGIILANKSVFDRFIEAYNACRLVNGQLPIAYNTLISNNYNFAKNEMHLLEFMQKGILEAYKNGKMPDKNIQIAFRDAAITVLADDRTYSARKDKQELVIEVLVAEALYEKDHPSQQAMTDNQQDVCGNISGSLKKARELKAEDLGNNYYAPEMLAKNIETIFERLEKDLVHHDAVVKSHAEGGNMKPKYGV